MIGITEAANALEAARDLLGATRITAAFDTNDGEFDFAVHPRGLVVRVDGELVELGGHDT